jgi:hypothetical protein
MKHPNTLAADRKKIRDGLATMKQSQGLLGPVVRGNDREAVKPFLFLQVKRGAWVVAHQP